MRRLALLGAVGAALSVAAPAQAYFAPGATITSASAERQEQGDDGSSFSAVAAEGRFAAIQTRARNFFADDDPDPVGAYRVGGIFRKDLASGALTLVAGGDQRRESDDSLLIRGAQNPSISADGRYVAFSTGEALVPADVNGAVDVYVRDMTLAPSESGAYELVSARDGGDVPAGYAAPQTSFPNRNPGSDVTRGAAISRDGRMVVFKTIAASDLPAAATPDVPAFQVFVRDRAAKTTRLVTRDMSSGAPVGGALGPAGISGDGSTVAWPGRQAPEQTPFRPGEVRDSSAPYYLWQRLADSAPGAFTPTRRITGIVDQDDPACPAGTPVTTDPTATGPCYGPLTVPESAQADISSSLPSLSDDGRHVAFLTGAGPRPDPTTGGGLDLYVTDMTPGVSRKAGTVELTREGSGDPAASYPIDTATLSGNGQRIAMTTERTVFVLPALRLVDEPRRVADARELYFVDLPSRTIERAVRGFDGGDAAGDVLGSATLSGTGDRLAFASSASNLFFGDANDRPDTFTVVHADGPPVIVRPRPKTCEETHTCAPQPSRPATLRVTSRSLRRGVVVVTVQAPAAGSLTVEAYARVRGARLGAPRRVARSSTRVKRTGSVRARIRLTHRYATLLRRQHVIRGRLTVKLASPRQTFTAHPPVTFTQRGPSR